MAQTRDLAVSLASLGFDPLRDAHAAARSILASSPSHYSAIDEEWNALLRELAGAGPSETDFIQSAEARAETLSDGSEVSAEASALAMPELAEGTDESGARGNAYSPAEALRQKDFASYTPDEMEAAKRFMARMVWRPPHRVSRRRRADRHGAEIHMRRLIRKSLPQGGEIMSFPRQAKQTKPRPLVVLCDVSGSMDVYSRMLLRFLHAFRSCLPGAEVFLFGTRLTRVTRLLEHTAPDEAIAGVAREVTDWSGGTRIGDALASFNRVWARRVSAHGAVTMIISDGWDRGDPNILAREMARVQRLSYRVLWLNPLIGGREYEPLTQGMRAALPFVDDFVAANNLASLESLANLLNELDGSQRGRRRA